MNVVVTTGRKFQPDMLKLAKETADKLGVPFVYRQRESIEEMMWRLELDYVLVAKKKLLVLETGKEELFFHPNMAHLRLKNLRFGKGDHMVEAMDLKEGMEVLDSTMGLGADAVVAAFVVGKEGRVTSLEKNPLIHTVISYGLKFAPGDNYPMQEAMRRVNTVLADHREYLGKLPDKSYDVVYFDPMFRHPIQSSISLSPLRGVAESSPLSLEAVTEARRVAKHRIVLKENRLSREFARLGFDKIFGGRYSRIAYGVIEV